MSLIFFLKAKKFIREFFAALKSFFADYRIYIYRAKHKQYNYILDRQDIKFRASQIRAFFADEKDFYFFIPELEEYE